MVGLPGEIFNDRARDGKPSQNSEERLNELIEQMDSIKQSLERIVPVFDNLVREFRGLNSDFKTELKVYLGTLVKKEN